MFLLCAALGSLLAAPPGARADQATLPLRQHLQTLGANARAGGHQRVGSAILGLESDIARLEAAPTMTVERMGERTTYTGGDTTIHTAHDEVTVERTGDQASLTVAKLKGATATWDSRFTKAGRARAVAIFSTTVDGRNQLQVRRSK